MIKHLLVREINTLHPQRRAINQPMEFKVDCSEAFLHEFTEEILSEGWLIDGRLIKSEPLPNKIARFQLPELHGVIVFNTCLDQGYKIHKNNLES